MSRLQTAPVIPAVPPRDRTASCFANLARQGRMGLLSFITAGDPHPEQTVPLMHALVDGGANVLELGVPFSDPMADGPTIQRASERALAAGTTLAMVLDMVAEFRRRDADTPVILMGYLNPVEAMGTAHFARRAARAGVDGVLLVDMPPEQHPELLQSLGRHALQPIFLLSPTTTESRMQEICQQARGFLYYVSLKGVTGSDRLDLESLCARLALVRNYSTLPLVAGFGIRDAETVLALRGLADGVVIGSALVECIAGAVQRGVAPTSVATDFMRSLRRQLDQAPSP